MAIGPPARRSWLAAFHQLLSPTLPARRPDTRRTSLSNVPSNQNFIAGWCEKFQYNASLKTTFTFSAKDDDFASSYAKNIYTVYSRRKKYTLHTEYLLITLGNNNCWKLTRRCCSRDMKLRRRTSHFIAAADYETPVFYRAKYAGYAAVWNADGWGTERDWCLRGLPLGENITWFHISRGTAYRHSPSRHATRISPISLLCLSFACLSQPHARWHAFERRFPLISRWYSKTKTAGREDGNE